MKKNIENLVFKGGGVLGTAYAGAIQALDEEGMLNNIRAVAGTSAGAIMATLLSLKYTPSEIKKIMNTANYSEFEDRWDPLRITTKYGLYKGEYFLKWIKKIIKEKTNNANITFSELSSLGYRDLKVYATDLNAYDVKEFSEETTPDVRVSESIRASMSIPFLFTAWQFTDDNPDNHIYVDGGTLYNYPITAFKDISKTLGFFLDDGEKVKNSKLGYNEITKYTKTLFKTLMRSQDIEFKRNPIENSITVKIDSLGVAAIDFNISKKTKDQLYESGLESTKKHLKTMDNRIGDLFSN